MDKYIIKYRSIDNMDDSTESSVVCKFTDTVGRPRNPSNNLVVFCAAHNTEYHYTDIYSFTLHKGNCIRGIHNKENNLVLPEIKILTGYGKLHIFKSSNLRHCHCNEHVGLEKHSICRICTRRVHPNCCKKFTLTSLETIANRIMNYEEIKIKLKNKEIPICNFCIYTWGIN